MEEFYVTTRRKIEVVDITEEVERRLKPCKAVLLFLPHATATLMLNEFEPNIKEDYEKFYSSLAKGEWKHNIIDNNAEAHLISSLTKPFLLIPCDNRRLALGTWQRILLLELDGPRKRKVRLTFL